MPPPTDTGSEPLFDRLRARSKQIVIDGETYWRVEGDLLLDEDQLSLYAQREEALKKVRLAAQDGGLGLVATAELVGTTQNGRIIRWAPGVELSYAVLRQTFALGGADGYQLAVESVRQATADWERVCGVRFSYKPELDKSAALAPSGALFVVREFDAGGVFIASAFLPTDPVNRRRVLIDPSFYEPTLAFDRVGVLRHELGHVLGFRHEHIRSERPAGCPDEDTYGTINLSDYDPGSVMHYFCGGVGSTTLSITEKDRIASQRVYGPPLSDFHFVR